MHAYASLLYRGKLYIQICNMTLYMNEPPNRIPGHQRASKPYTRTSTSLQTVYPAINEPPNRIPGHQRASKLYTRTSTSLQTVYPANNEPPNRITGHQRASKPYTRTSTSLQFVYPDIDSAHLPHNLNCPSC